MARWTDLAPRQEHTKAQDAGGMVEHRGVVLHIASGFYEGTIDYQKNDANAVSSHFIVGRDGSVCQMVDTSDKAWTQRAGNGHWLSVEFEGFAPDDDLHATHPGWERLTSQQVEKAAQIFARSASTYGHPLQIASDPTGRGLGHHSMGGTGCTQWNWGHCHCPGNAIIGQKAAIVALAKEIINGGTFMARLTDEEQQELLRLMRNAERRATAEADTDDPIKWPSPWKPNQGSSPNPKAQILQAIKALEAKVDALETKISTITPVGDVNVTLTGSVSGSGTLHAG